MSKLKDPIRDGLGRGWKVLGGKHAALPEKINCDVAIIGSGAGSGITAELLARAEQWRPWRAYAALHLWATDTVVLKAIADARRAA